MIKITINRHQDQFIKSFTISGHANFAVKGSDIVCAGVSAVSFGTVNAILKLTSVQLQVEQGKDGFLHCVVPTGINETDQEKVQLLLNGMEVALQTIARDYSRYVKIVQTTREVD